MLVGMHMVCMSVLLLPCCICGLAAALCDMRLAQTNANRPLLL